jgi:hypothetical protein
MGQWDVQLVRRNFLAPDATAILNILCELVAEKINLRGHWKDQANTLSKQHIALL